MTLAAGRRLLRARGLSVAQGRRDGDPAAAPKIPTYLYYTLGKLEILKLRDDYQKKLGPAFTLEKFHDAFLAQGPLPLPLLRQALLGE